MQVWAAMVMIAILQLLLMAIIAEVSYNSSYQCRLCWYPVGRPWQRVIKNNFVNTTNYIKDDGGGIYCYPIPVRPGGHSHITQENRKG
jgi:hypothetical protein